MGVGRGSEVVRGGVREVCEGCSSSLVVREVAAREEEVDSASVMADSAIGSFVVDDRAVGERVRVTRTFEERTDVIPSTTVVSRSTEVSVLLPPFDVVSTANRASSLPPSFFPSPTASPTMSTRSATIPRAQKTRFFLDLRAGSSEGWVRGTASFESLKGSLRSTTAGPPAEWRLARLLAS